MVDFVCYRCGDWPCQCKDGITLIHGDCHVLLPHLGQVDVVITDPPYGEQTHKGARAKFEDDESPIRFDAISDAEYLALTTTLVNMTNRWVVMTCEWRHAAKLEESGLPLIRLGVWVKPNSAPQYTGDRPGTGWEAIAMLHRKGKKRWNGGGKHAVWRVNVESGLHPTQKPVPLLAEWCNLFSDPGELILDPFCGSGSTLVAARATGRRAIGIEQDIKHIRTACDRLRYKSLFWA